MMATIEVENALAGNIDTPHTLSNVEERREEGKAECKFSMGGFIFVDLGTS